MGAGADGSGDFGKVVGAVAGGTTAEEMFCFLKHE